MICKLDSNYTWEKTPTSARHPGPELGVWCVHICIKRIYDTYKLTTVIGTSLLVREKCEKYFKKNHTVKPLSFGCC